MPGVWEAVYTSVIGEATPPSAILDIVRHARRRNRLNGITGILLFDGRHLCQYLEGSRDAVQALLSRIEHDPRHRDLATRHDGAIGERRFGRWSLGYGVDAEGVIARISALPGAGIPAALVELLLQVDLEPGLAF